MYISVCYTSSAVELCLTVLPFASGRVDVAKQLIVGDGLWVEVLPDWFLLEVLVGLVERPQDLGLARASVADDKDGVADM